MHNLVLSPQSSSSDHEDHPVQSQVGVQAVVVVVVAVHDCDSDGLLVLTPQKFESIHNLACCPELQVVHPVHCQLGVHTVVHV